MDFVDERNITDGSGGGMIGDAERKGGNFVMEE